jgi:hypothetical protein
MGLVASFENLNGLISIVNKVIEQRICAILFCILNLLFILLVKKKNLEQKLNVKIGLFYKFFQLVVCKLLNCLRLLEIVLIKVLKVLVIYLLLVHQMLFRTWFFRLGIDRFFGFWGGLYSFLHILHKLHLILSNLCQLIFGKLFIFFIISFW